MSATAMHPKVPRSVIEGWTLESRWCAVIIVSAVDVPHDEVVELWMFTACSRRCGHSDTGAEEGPRMPHARMEITPIVCSAIYLRYKLGI